MPDIAHIGGSSSLGPVNSGTSLASAIQGGVERPETSIPRPSDDSVEVSDRARLLSRLRELPEIRTERVDDVRRAIADGSYLTDEKISGALDALLEDL